ncbi:MAG: HAD-IIIC family phosphatase [Bacteroides fragilis]
MDILYAVPFTDDDYQLQAAVAEYNNALYVAEAGHKNVKVIDITEFTRKFNTSELFDWKFYFISQMGMNPKLSKDFKAWWDKKQNSISLKRKKCLVLDLDNTLWGGVLGEEGIDGIKIGGDYPGKAFLYWQEALLDLSKSGVILTVCSKNNEQDVLDAWDKNPFNVLKKEHFVAYRINWTDKATNIKELASELNIGLDSFVFVDDNPTERELIKQMLPMVEVPEFPTQPYGLMSFL